MPCEGAAGLACESARTQSRNGRVRVCGREAVTKGKVSGEHLEVVVELNRIVALVQRDAERVAGRERRQPGGRGSEHPYA